jgi:hypothetical protein
MATFSLASPLAAAAEQAAPRGGLAGAASSPEAAAAAARARSVADRSRELAAAHDQLQLIVEETRLEVAKPGKVVQVQYFDYRGVPLAQFSYTFGEVGAPQGAAPLAKAAEPISGKGAGARSSPSAGISILIDLL